MLYCSSTVALSEYTVRLGSYLLSGPDVNRVSRSVKLARNHPNYEAHYSGYDISVLTLSEAVHYNDYIRPVCLVSPHALLSSSLICYSTGWGLTNYSDSQYPLVHHIFTCSHSHFPTFTIRHSSTFAVSSRLKIHPFKLTQQILFTKLATMQQTTCRLRTTAFWYFLRSSVFFWFLFCSFINFLFIHK